MTNVDLNGTTYEMDYYKDYIRDFLPVIDQLRFSKAQERLIQKAFLKRLMAVNKSVIEQGVFQADACLFDFVFDAKDGNKSQIAHLKWLDDQLSVILNKLDKVLLRKFDKTLVGLFIDFDNSKSRYLSRAGEIAFLSRMLNFSEVTIIDIERKLSNGKSIDFVIQTSFDEVSRMIEVVSISVAVEKIEDSRGLRTFLEKRLLDKFQDKGQGLLKIPFSIAPVVWAEDIHSFYRYADAFALFEEKKGVILPPLGLYYFKKNDGIICISELVTNAIKRRAELEQDKEKNNSSK